jgi:hypothetical protein
VSHPTKLAEYLAEGAKKIPKGKQAEFAAQCGMTRGVLWHYVVGDRRPGVKYALAIEAASNGAVPLSYWAAFKPRPLRRRSRSSR